MNVSVVIRAYNEARRLERLLEAIEAQQYDGQVEVIVVDNGSVDETAEVAQAQGARVVSLAQREFSYPKSLNLGIAGARYPVVLCTVAHACPAGPQWISSATKHFVDPQVAGVFSYTLAEPDGSFYDKLFNLSYWYTQLRGPVRVRWVHMGVFGANNLAIRRSAWRQHPFDERYGAGGEDTAWAEETLKRGLKIIREPAFVVRHSHYLRTFRQLRAQYRVWDSLKQPRPFDRSELSFRDID